MALDPLAEAADLTARHITVPSGYDADTILLAASTAVREAAGCAISELESGVTLVAYDEAGVDLPGVPVTAVDSVAVNGVTVPAATLTAGRYSAGWRLVDNALVFKGQCYETPADVAVTYTHGFAVVPEDIVDMVCGLAAMAFAADGTYGSLAASEMVKLGDYAEKRAVAPGSESPSPMSIPPAVREQLRARFGTNVAVLRVH